MNNKYCFLYTHCFKGLGYIGNTWSRVFMNTLYQSQMVIDSNGDKPQSQKMYWSYTFLIWHQQFPLFLIDTSAPPRWIISRRQSQKMYSFVPRAKMNGKVGFHAWFFMNGYSLQGKKCIAALCSYLCISMRPCSNRLLREVKWLYSLELF